MASNIRHLSGEGEWRGGVSPPRSRRTGRESLDSSGSHHHVPHAGLRRPRGWTPNLPVGEEFRLHPFDGLQPARRTAFVGSESLIFPLCPTHQAPTHVTADALERRGAV